MWNRNLTHTRIKICEFETLDEIREISGMGADAFGFHLFRHHADSNRILMLSSLIEATPLEINRVLLSDLNVEDLIRIASILRVNTIQLYTDYGYKDMRRLRSRVQGDLKVLKVMSAHEDENVAPDRDFLNFYEDLVDGFLLDSYRRGGTGVPANWTHCATIRNISVRPIFLAGGLTPENVGEAIAVTRPYGVDVETGVSDRLPNGHLRKNPDKCRRFIEAVRVADARQDHVAGSHS